MKYPIHIKTGSNDGPTSRKISLHKLVSKLSELAERHKERNACIKVGNMNIRLLRPDHPLKPRVPFRRVTNVCRTSSTDSDEGLAELMKTQADPHVNNTTDNNNTIVDENTNDVENTHDTQSENTIYVIDPDKINTVESYTQLDVDGDMTITNTTQKNSVLCHTSDKNTNNVNDATTTPHSNELGLDVPCCHPEPSKGCSGPIIPVSGHLEEEAYEPVDLSTVKVNTHLFPSRRDRDTRSPDNSLISDVGVREPPSSSVSKVPMVVLGSDGTVPNLPCASATPPVSDPVVYRITPYIPPQPAVHYQGRFLGQKIFQYSSETIAAVSTPQLRGGVHVGGDILRPSSLSLKHIVCEKSFSQGPPVGTSEGGSIAVKNTDTVSSVTGFVESSTKSVEGDDTKNVCNTGAPRTATATSAVSGKRQTATTGPVSSTSRSSPPSTTIHPHSQIRHGSEVSGPPEPEDPATAGPMPNPNMPKATPENYLSYAHHSVDYIVRYISMVHMGLTDLVQGLSKIQRKRGGGSKSEGAENEDQASADTRTAVVARANAAHILCSSAMTLVTDLRNTVLAAQTAMRDEELGQGYIRSNVSALHYVEIETDIIDVPWSTNTAFINATIISLPEPAVLEVYRNTVYYFLNQMRLYGTSCQICISCIKQDPLYQLRNQLKNIQNLCVTLIIKNHSFAAVPSYSNRIARQLICDEEGFIQAHPFHGNAARPRQGFASYKYAMLVSSSNLGDLICAGHLCLQACYNCWPIVHVYTRRCRGPM
ncbi:nuclear protein ORF-K [Elephant endotheliotropic herpesvirus 6]|nr:nuclear protein ORF-K [Elephant endotheliotropic herpesvirus 6]UEH20662.1 nuclear protein ORF-K [Elephant endotheliotropic herpesvirus 6]